MESHKVVFKEEDLASKLFIIKEGEVLCLKQSKDRLIPVFLAQKGDILGEAAILADGHHTYSAITLTRVDLVEIPASSFTDAMKHSPEWLRGLTSTMVSRFQSTANLIAENRIIHSSVITEDRFPSQLEIEFKKLLG